MSHIHKLFCSARQKLTVEDLAGLEQQVKLQAGEVETTDAERPADAVPNNPMVFCNTWKQ